MSLNNEKIELAGLPRLWLGDDGAGNQVMLFRRTFDIGAVGDVLCAGLAVFADARYQLWLNGIFAGRGPTPFTPGRSPVAQYNALPFLRNGRNVLAVAVLAQGFSTHTYCPAGTPGPVLRLQIETAAGIEEICTDAAWRACPQSGWRQDVPRRSWAIGCIESFDANAAPPGWQEPGFDDAAWMAAEPRPPFGTHAHGMFIYPELPGLRTEFVPPARLLGCYSAAGPRYMIRQQDSCAAFGRALMAETWSADCTFTAVHNQEDGSVEINGLDESVHAALCFDLGREYAGGLNFSMDSDSGGVIDLGWAELLEDGRPAVMRKGSTYADRYAARPGRNDWLPVNFSAGRFLLLVLRGFAGKVTFRRLGWLATEPALDWRGSFTSSDPRLDEIWRLCEYSLRVGVQEGPMDCPTREQAVYVGDGNPIAKWLRRVTGDSSHWRHLIEETFALQGESGLVKSTLFSGRNNVLLDYNLLAIVWLHDYVLETGDRETAARMLPVAGRILDWFASWCNADGLFVFDWEQRQNEQWNPAGILVPVDEDRWLTAGETQEEVLRNPTLTVFIDHPGWGAHNVNEPGIDRRGLNAAMNALYVLALRAQARLCGICGRPAGAEELQARAERTVKAAACFWNAAENVFCDGIRNGSQLPQISQQTNIWCIMAGFAADRDVPTIIRRVLADDAVARCGPYFYCYLLPLLAEYDMHREALDLIRVGWGCMLDNGATTLWETFAGDELDSFCHPWAAAPLDFLQRHIAGIGTVMRNGGCISLRPRLDLIDHAEARVATENGCVSIAWRREHDGVHLEAETPAGTTGKLILPDGGTLTIPAGSRIRHLQTEP